jgi:ribonuclease D
MAVPVSVLLLILCLLVGSTSVRFHTRKHARKYTTQHHSSHALYASSHKDADDHTDVLYVDTKVMFEAMMQHLVSQSEVALDLEFDRGLHSRGYKLCLLQLASGEGKIFILDPFGVKDLKPLYRDVLENEKILKVMHACDSDLDILKQQACYPVNIFDTQIAATLLGLPIGLSSLLNHFYQFGKDKNIGLSDWTKRPLNEEQLDYAANDVRYLSDIRTKLTKLAEDKKVIHWVDIENRALDERKRMNQSLLSGNARRLLSKRQTPFIEVYTFERLYSLRYSQSVIMSMEYSPKKLMSDDVMLDLVQEAMQGVFQRTHTQDSKAIENAVRRAFIRNVHPKLRNLAAKQIFVAELVACMKEIRKNPDKFVSKADDGSDADVEGSPVSALRKKKYEPVKKMMASEYGLTAAQFLFPRWLITQLACEDLGIDMRNPKPIPAYRRELITKLLADREALLVEEGA